MNTTVTGEGAGEYMRQLADELATTGVLSDPAWRRAWETVPRHVFVQRFAISASGRSGRAEVTWYDGANPDQRAKWMAAAYRNEALITSYAPNGAVISSSTEPSLMAYMLDQLDVHDGQKVLEIGTGTGYNAALLAHRLGPDNVTTIDIDPHLTQTAMSALNMAGYPVTVLTGDGSHGAPEQAPFGRIIATCGVDRIPAAWINQLAPDGAILANVSRGLIVLRRDSDNTISGQYYDQAGFMALHTGREAPPPTSSKIFDITGVSAQRLYETAVPPDLDFTVASFLASLIAERSHVMFVYRADGTVAQYRWWHPASESWVRVESQDSGAARIHETGTRHLWAQLAPLLAEWENAGRPDIDQFGLTVTTQYHRLWIGSSSLQQGTLPYE